MRLTIILSTLPQYWLAKAIELIIAVHEGHAAVETEDNDCVTTPTRPQLSMVGKPEQTLRLAQIAADAECQLQNDITTGMALPLKNLVGKRRIDLTLPYDLGTCDAMRLHEISKIIRQTSDFPRFLRHVVKVMLWINGGQEPIEKLLRQRPLEVALTPEPRTDISSRADTRAGM
jgi:hypothetical protein